MDRRQTKISGHRPKKKPPLPSGERVGVRGSSQLRNLPLPWRERAGVTGSSQLTNPPLPSGERAGVRGSSQLESATDSLPDPNAPCAPPVHAPCPRGHKPKLLDQVRQALRSRHYSRRTTMIYPQALNRGGRVVPKPADRLAVGHAAARVIRKRDKTTHELDELS